MVMSSAATALGAAHMALLQHGQWRRVGANPPRPGAGRCKALDAPRLGRPRTVTAAAKNAAEAAPEPTEHSAGPATLDQVMESLQQPVPEGMLKEMTVERGKILTYIPWFNANRILNDRVPGWSGEVRNVVFSNSSVTVTYRVAVPTSNCGLVYRDATGTEPLGSQSFGDPVQKAEQQAFRRACARLGLGLDLYGAEDAPAPGGGAPAAGGGGGRGGGRGRGG